MNAVSLFGNNVAATISADLQKSLVFKESKGGSHIASLLPTSSKAGDSIKSLFNVSGSAAKAIKRRMQKELLTRMAAKQGELAACGLYGGHKLTVTKSGKVSFTYSPLTEAKDAAEAATVVAQKDAQIAKLMAELEAIKAAAAK